MASCYICDRCGEIIIPSRLVHTLSDENEDEDYDLCPNCYKEFKKWVLKKEEL